MSLKTEDTKDLTQYTEREMELMVFNIESLYNLIDISDRVQTLENLGQYFVGEGYKFTGEQWSTLLVAVSQDITERRGENVQF